MTKEDYLKQQKNEKIQYENALLVNNIVKVKTRKNQHENPNYKSMNIGARMEEMKKIDEQNKSMLGRLSSTKSVVSRSFNDPEATKFIRPAKPPSKPKKLSPLSTSPIDSPYKYSPFGNPPCKEIPDLTVASLTSPLSSGSERKQLKNGISPNSSTSSPTSTKSSPNSYLSQNFFEKKQINKNIYLYGTNKKVDGYNSPVDIYIWENVITYEGKKGCDGLLVEIKNKILPFSKLITVNELKNICSANSKIYKVMCNIPAIKKPDIYKSVSEYLNFNEDIEQITILCEEIVKHIQISDNVIMVTFPKIDYNLTKTASSGSSGTGTPTHNNETKSQTATPSNRSKEVPEMI